MRTKVLQVNLNGCWKAYDMMEHQILEMGIGICVVSEPWRIPNSPFWFGSGDKKAAIRWISEKLEGGGCILKRKGKHFVMAKWREAYIVACYISPNAERDIYLEFLDELEDVVREIGQGIVIGGDFNARSPQWDRKGNWKGDLVEECAAGSDMKLKNERIIPTCVRPQGTSIVDLTWASPEVVRVEDWRVLEDVETCFDHAYIQYWISMGSATRSETKNK